MSSNFSPKVCIQAGFLFKTRKRAAPIVKVGIIAMNVISPDRAFRDALTENISSLFSILNTRRALFHKSRSTGPNGVTGQNGQLGQGTIVNSIQTIQLKNDRKQKTSCSSVITSKITVWRSSELSTAYQLQWIYLSKIYRPLKFITLWSKVLYHDRSLGS